MKEANKNTIKSLLKDEVCEVTFTKADGSERLMVCTLSNEEMNKSKTFVDMQEKRDPNKAPSKPLAEHLIRVWDLENDGWRTINFNTVITFEMQHVPI